MRRFIWAAAFTFGVFSGGGHAQTFSTAGTDFWCAFPENSTAGSLPQLRVYISSATATTATVSIPLGAFTQTVAVPAGGSVLVQVPTAQGLVSGSNVTTNRGVRVTAPDSINVFIANAKQFSTDASVVLPSATLRDEYRVLTYDDNTSGSAPQGCQFTVVAVEDNTTIEITPTAQVVGVATGAGVPYQITLNAGQVYQGQSLGDLTGTRLVGVGPPCRRFAVFGGHLCTNILDPAPGVCEPVPGGTPCCCDHILEQMYPINTWGQEYVGVRFINRQRNLYRVLANEANTQVTITGASGTLVNTTLNAGEFVDEIAFEFSDPIVYITGDKPIAVGHFNLSNTCNPATQTDPFYVMLAPVEQNVTRATISALDLATSGPAWSHRINLVSPTNGTATVTVNGGPPTGVWQPVPGNPALSYITHFPPPGPGEYLVEADSGFVAYIYGDNQDDSYGYMAGFALDNTNLRISADIAFPGPVCVGEAIQFEGQAVQPIATWAWEFGDGTTATGQIPAPKSYTLPGSYTVKLEAQGLGTCGTDGLDSAFAQVVVVGPGADTAVTPVACNGGADGVIVLTPLGGTPPYVITPLSGQVASPPGSFTYPGLAAGAYAFEVADQGACRDTLVVQVPEPLPLLLATTSTTDLGCNGDNSGGIALAASGGNAPFTYTVGAINQPGNGQFTGLAAGTYLPTVTDANGCTAGLLPNPAVVLGEPPLLTLGSAVTDATCADPTAGQVELLPGGGTAPYTYSSPTLGANGANPVYTGLVIGTYDFEVTDANGCTANATATVNSPTNIAVNVVNTVPVACTGGADGSVTLNGTSTQPPLAFSLDGTNFQASATFSGLAVGNYTATVQDALGCIATVSFAIAEPATPLALVLSPQNPSCAGDDGAVAALSSGGTPPYAYSSSVGSINPTTGQLENLGAVSGAVTVTDANNCTITENFTLTAPPPSFVQPDTAVCRSDTTWTPAQGLPPGGTWSGPGVEDPATGAVNTLGGPSPRTLTYTGPGACPITFELTILPGPDASFSYTPTDLQAPDASTAQFTSADAPNVLYAWTFGDSANTTSTDPTPTFTYPEAGTYIVTLMATDALGCVRQDSLQLLVTEEALVVVPTGFSPNGDGTNDQWRLIFVNAETYELTVYSRWGLEAFRTAGQNPQTVSWDGTRNGTPVPEGVYVYDLSLRYTNGRESRQQGTVTLIR